MKATQPPTASHLSILTSMRKHSKVMVVDSEASFPSRVAWIAWPQDQPQRFNGCNIPCDAWTGPCCCGAWHTEGK